ncbi:NAD(P)/FAD-dependent oxidoreductase [Actinacidiphila sp. DG2A-62]|uniref:phytoene desaturase family protein n=1 Tax=Actinacidiphila sp. DG2A-62 TaxID=3108821 RepID=UPI002DB775FF|nr:NAD(P)/FAD-dependent oxidoreductase [Actinacidiphila sp. DG2A-62]MEC3993754.1 NAD(P)/FAD-dependent oxidoreductase [Actinacidiphila sp. DG2A-62]
MYDVIVIGAGVNGLSAGLNLAASGLRTLILDRSGRAGGQAVTHEPLLPGFLVHPHANYLSYRDLHALQPDPASRVVAARAVRPVAQHGLAFRDGGPPVVLHRRDHQDRTRRSLARHSVRDARTYARCKKIADQLTPALSALFFSSPRAESFAGDLAEVARAFDGVVDPKLLGSRSARALIDELFEADAVRTLFYLLFAEFSGDLEEPGGDVGVLGYVFWLLGRRELPLGGMGAVPDALARAAAAAGAEIRLDAEVARVVVERGAVRGVRLRDGSLLRAPMVASSIGYDVHLRELMEPADLSAAERTALARFEKANAGLIGSYAACLTQPPRYASGAHDADIDACAQTFVGLDNTGEVLDHFRGLRSGELPAPCGPVRVNTLWDPGQAPAGHHVAGADCAFPDGLDDAYLSGVGRSYPAAFTRMWKQYAPGVEDSVLAQHISLSREVNRTMSLREGDGQYRGHARGLYFCGSSTHPGGGVHGACGVNAYRVMTADRSAGVATA